jgi:ferrochelatase
MPRRAIILMNLGAPDSPEAVRPFLINLFADPAILTVPNIFRRPLAQLIAKRRLKVALDIYNYLGGGSPLLANTKTQAWALEATLGDGSRCFIAMRHWHPTTDETAEAVKAWEPDEIVCLPLYPQYSTTTTGSSLTRWRRVAASYGFNHCPTREIEFYPTAPGFVAALADLIGSALDEATADTPRVRLLLSAHGLPLKIVQAGDPYPQQVAETAEAVVAALARPDLDWTLCYQSRVGPLKWLGPAADDEIRRAGSEGIGLVIAPISFVSEHSETLVELDRDYRNLADACGVSGYYRVPTVGTHPDFIDALATLVQEAV